MHKKVKTVIGFGGIFGKKAGTGTGFDDFVVSLRGLKTDCEWENFRLFGKRCAVISMVLSSGFSCF